MACLSTEQILAYVNGELPEAEAAATKAHLLQCPLCTAQAGGFSRVGRLLRDRLAQKPAGACLAEAEIVAYLHRTMKTLPEDRIQEIESHLASCEACLDDLLLLVEVTADRKAGRMPAGPEGLKDRVMEKIEPVMAKSGTHTRRLATRTATARRLAAVPRREDSSALRIFAMAAGVLIAVLAVAMFTRSDREPGGRPRVARNAPPAPGVQPAPPPAPVVAVRPSDAPAPVRPAGTGTVVVPAGHPQPAVAARPEESTPAIRAPEPEPKPESPLAAEPPKPAVSEPPVPPAPENRGTVAAALPEAAGPIEVAPVEGVATLLPADGSAGRPVSAPFTLQPGDRVAASGVAPARLALAGGHRVDLREKSSLSGKTAGGAVALRLHEGAAMFTVAKTEKGFSVETPEALTTVHGTVFTLAMEKNRTTLSVVEGVVDFGNKQGTVTVRKDQQASAARGLAPSSPALNKAGVTVAMSWVPGPPVELPAKPETKEPTLVLTRAAGARFPGLVVTAAFADMQPAVDTLARAVVQDTGCGSVFGYNFISGGKWYAVDRPFEAPYYGIGRIGAVKTTKAAQEHFDTYLADIAQAGGVKTGPVKLLVELRGDWVSDGAGRPVEAVEMATNGFTKRTLDQAKAAWAQLAKARGIESPIPLFIDALDETYALQGRTLKFHHPHPEQKSIGSMRPVVAERAATIYWQMTFDKKDTLKQYGPLFADFVQWLYRN